jgi:hypothetical protein
MSACLMSARGAPRRAACFVAPAWSPGRRPAGRVPPWPRGRPGRPAWPVGTRRSVRPLGLLRLLRDAAPITTDFFVGPVAITTGPLMWSALRRGARGGPAGGRTWLLCALTRATPLVGPVRTGAAAPTSQLRSDAAWPRPVDQLDPVGVRCFWRARWFDGHDRDPVNAEFGLGSYDVAGPRIAVEERAVYCPSRVEGACRAPRPGPIRPRACELDLDTACHRTNVQLRSGSAHHRSQDKVVLVFCHSDETPGLRLVRAANRTARWRRAAPHVLPAKLPTEGFRGPQAGARAWAD